MKPISKSVLTPSLRIIIVDDDRNILDCLTIWLKTLEYTVEPVSNCSQAKKLLTKKTSQPTVLITDLELDGESGESLLTYILEKQIDVKGAILITGSLNFDLVFSRYLPRFNSASIPFHGLTKPFDLKDLKELLTRIAMKKKPASSCSEQKEENVKFLNSINLGKMIKAARETLGVSQAIVVSTAKQRIKISLQEYRTIEKGRELTPEQWYYLCPILELPFDAITYGYDKNEHLKRIQGAIRSNAFSLPITEHLKKELTALDQTENNHVQCDESEL